MSRFQWARLLRRKRPSTVDAADVEALQRAYDAAYSLSRGPGWAWLVTRVEAEMTMCLDKLIQPVTERERDYYASRADTLAWLLTLPETAANDYATALNAAADNLSPSVEGPWDPASPV